MLLRSLLILLACLSLAFAATPAQAAQVQLAWDAPLQDNGTPIPNLAGYKLFYGSQSGQYPTMVCDSPMTTCTVPNVSAGQPYYFAVKAYDSTGRESAFSNEVSVTLGIIPQQQMRVVSVDSQELVGENGAATNAIDGNPATFWHTEWSQRTAPLPHTLVLDLGGQYQVDGFRYLPRQDGAPNGTMAGYQFSVSPDGTTWGTAVAAGTLAADATEKTVRFTAKPGRYVRLVALSEMNGNPWTSAAELNIFGTIVTPKPSLTLSAAPATLASGQTATVTWAATNATTCAAPWTASTATASSQAVKPTTTTTYTMTCTGAGGTATASTVVTVTPKPSLTLSAAPATLASGQTATVTWAATNATTCAAPWTASTAPAGSQAVKPTTTTTYTMTCTGAGGTATASTVVTVGAKPSLTLSAVPAALAAGQTATVTWAATNATTCAAPWTASTAPAGSQAVKPTTTTTYTMTCTGAGGTATASTVVTVTPKPSLTLSAAPATLASGQTATVTWAATNATTCAAPWTASTATASSQAVKPTTTTTYTMTCTGAGGTATASTVVTVTPKPSLTLSAAPATLASGQTATVTWAATNATTCAAPWTASTAPAGSQAVKPTTTTTYTMTCTGAGGTATASTVVTVGAKPSLTLSAVPAALAAGQTATVTWAATNATTCAAPWTASTAPAGSQAVKPTTTTTYTMTCTGAGGTATASTVVTVGAKPSLTLSAVPAALAAGQTATVTWAATNATTCAAPWTASTASAGSQAVKPTTTTTYTMTCTGAGGTATASTTVSMNTLVSKVIPQQQFRVVSVDSQELVGENGAVTNAIDGNPATFWHTEWSQRTAPLPHTLVFDLGGQYQVDGFRYLPRQDGAPNGTMAGYQFYVSPDGTTWGTAVAAGTLAADATEKTVRFTAKPGRYVRLVALSEMNGNPWTSAAELNVFGTAVVLPPTSSLIPQQQFRVVSVDSQELVGENGAVTNAIDGNPATFWHTEWSQRTAPLPHTLVLDLGAQYQVDGFRYLPRQDEPQDGSPNGTMAGYQFYVSPDGTTWGTAVAAGTLAADTTEKTVRFTAKPGRYVRLVALSEMNGNPWTSAAELNVFGTAAPSPTTTTSGLLAQSVTTAPVTSSTSTSTTTASTTPQALTTVASAMSPSSTTTTSQSSPKTASAMVLSLTSVSPTMTVSQNTRWELTLTSMKTYTNPFLDVTVTVEYTKAGAPSLHGYGFWDGDATFKLRQAFPEPGTWHYKTTATDPSNSGLHNREGEVQVLPYSGPNPLYRHGFLQVSADRRFFTHADGTPFLWLGDTLWGATVWLTEAGFHDAVADRRAKHFTVLQTNVAHEDEVDTAGDTPWQDDRWNVRFMQKLDRMFSDANDQGMYLFVNGLVDLFWNRGMPNYERLVEMIGARYAAHFVSFASSMDDPYDPLHEQLNAAIQRTAPRILVAQHPGTTTNGQGPVWTAEQYYDTPFVDYVMDATGGEGDLEVACQHAIEWSLRLYNHVPPKPIINGAAWYEDVAGGTAEMTAQLGYLSLLSGNAGYTYGTSLWNATDADIPAWQAFRGATYMQYLYDFFAALDEGRPFQPRHGLIMNQATRYQDRMVLGVSADGMTYTAFLPKGGTISVDLKALLGTTVGVTWYNPLTGQYHDQGTTSGGAVRSFVSPFGTSQSALVLMAQYPAPLGR